MAYWYEVIAPVADGLDDVSWEQLGDNFEHMIPAIEYARQHPDSKLFMVLEQDGVVDSVELPLEVSV